MKNLANIIIGALAIFILVSCSGKDSSTGSDNLDITEIFHEGSVEWYAAKVIGSGHEGTILIDDNNLEFEGGILSGGYISINMSTIKSTDLQGEKGKRLEKHLMSNDFFGVDSFPISTLRIKSVEGGEEKNTLLVSSDLTIRDVTLPFDFIVNYQVVDNKVVYASTIEIDRSKYGVKHGSTSFFKELGNKAINDVFTVKVHYVIKNTFS